MKKQILLFLLVSTAILLSCENNDNDSGDPASEKKLLLSKITTTYYDNPNNPETTISTLNYNDKGELMSSESEGRFSTLEYDAQGKPTKTNYYKPDKTLDYYSVYSYQGDKLMNIKAIYDNPNFNRSISFSYDSNGKVIKSSFCQSENCSNPDTDSYTYNGDNISVETNQLNGTINYTSKIESSYDDKLNPYTNINKYLRIMMGGAYVISRNNYTSQKMSYKKSDGNWTQNQTINYTIQYNDSNLPTKVIGKGANGNNYVEYNYEYITK